MLTLIRKQTDKFGTQGILFVDGIEYCKTLEPEIVAFPAGEYELYHYFSPGHGMDVLRYINPLDPTFAARYIEIHPGNIVQDTKGCTLVGQAYGWIDCAEAYPPDDYRHSLGVVSGVLGSKVIFKKMISEIKDATKILIVQA
jgi:hypothetical protein